MDSSLVAILGRGQGYVHVCPLSKFAKQVFCVRWPCLFECWADLYVACHHFILSYIVWFQKKKYPPRRGFAVWPPLPSGFSKIGPQNLPPLRSGISKIFTHPLEILLSLIEVNKEIVLFPRMPNFVSFVYFLLNCITDKRIPYANSLCAQVTDKFCAFHVISIEFYNSANEMQGRVGNITVLFSHCVKKKASLEEV